MTVWVGTDDFSRGENEYGSIIALPIWIITADYKLKALKLLQKKSLKKYHLSELINLLER